MFVKFVPTAVTTSSQFWDAEPSVPVRWNDGRRIMLG